MEINIKNTGKPFKLSEIEATMCVKELKERCAKECGISADQQRLFLKGKILKDEDTLEASRVGNGTTLFLVKGAATTSSTAGGEGSAAKPEEKKEEEEKEVFSVELCDNMWSLNYVAAIGQAKYGNGTYVTPGFTGIISVGMCVVQLAGLFLMIGAINPTALPWTKEPGAPWLKGESGMTVNLMKLFMTIFLAVGQVQEVSQSKKIITVAFSSGDHVYKKAWYKFIPLAGAALQYSVAMTVIWGGVATVLSFQTVPDIVYSSMSVFFFTTADEMFADATMQLFDITPDWEVQLSPEEEEAADPFKNEPIWMFLVLKFLQVFPAMFAFQLLGRAWMTGVMPIHHVDVPEPPAM
mmetsp:Transcript_44728/g.80421  ORF Transcript_44728/g.80421 Transcript_44728/m.80421 type:complete len:352 (-) Transcript_44728:193-1248(-)